VFYEEGYDKIPSSFSFLLTRFVAHTTPRVEPILFLVSKLFLAQKKNLGDDNFLRSNRNSSVGLNFD
jgi:hypothetical protein